MQCYRKKALFSIIRYCRSKSMFSSFVVCNLEQILNLSELQFPCWHIWNDHTCIVKSSVKINCKYTFRAPSTVPAIKQVLNKYQLASLLTAYILKLEKTETFGLKCLGLNKGNEMKDTSICLKGQKIEFINNIIYRVLNFTKSFMYNILPECHSTSERKVLSLQY